MKNELTPTTAASSQKRDYQLSSELLNPASGKLIQARKKVAERIDLVLESRGSIMTGRDEQFILQQKRETQQKHFLDTLK